MNRMLRGGLVVLAATPLFLSGCAGITIGAPVDSTFPSAPAPISASASALPSVAPGTVGIIIPESTKGSRWDEAGQQVLTDAFAAAGVPVDIRSAEGDPAEFVSIAEDMTNSGITVLAIVNLDPASGAEAIAAANSLGALVVDYDRLTPNGGAQYFVGIKDATEGAPVSPEAAKAEAEALVSITGALTSDDPSAADVLAVDLMPDPEAGYDVPAILVTP